MNQGPMTSLRLVAGLALTLLASTASTTQAQTTYPGNNTFFQTSGPSRAPTIGDWYTSSGTASTDRIHRFLVGVTPEQLAAAGGTVTVTVGDGESATGTGPLDEITGTADPTRFTLRASDGTTILATHTFPSGSANASSHVFSITTAGNYQITSETGAFPISGDATADLNNDDNSFTITVSSSAALFGPLQFSTQHNQGSGVTIPYYFLVGPTATGTSALELRNYDADSNATSVIYTRPSTATVTGTVSANGLWNGPAPTVNTGFDSVTATSTNTATGGDGGVWGFTVNSLSSGNQLIVEANGDSVKLVLFETPPTAAGSFVIGTNGTLGTLPGQAVDHSFTVLNDFQTNDIVNLTTSGTGANYTVQLLDNTLAPLTDTDGDGIVDTGILTPNQTKTYVLRVTPNAGATQPDVTRVNGVSFMDKKVDSVNNTVRFIERRTELAGVTVTPTSGLVTNEGGGQATFTVVLKRTPTAPVTFSLASSDASEGTVSPSSLTFTVGNALVPQTVTVTGVEDALLDGAVPFTITTGAGVSGDPLYSGLDPSDVSVTNNDNDSPGVTVTPTSGLTTTEAGGTANFSVVLNTIPSANVTIPVSSSNTAEGTVSTTTLTFTPGNALTPQTVTLTGADDQIDDGDVAYTAVLGAASGAAEYVGIDPTDVSVTNSDDDTAAVIVSPTSGLLTTEPGGQATFTVRLATIPTAPMTYTLISSDTSEGTVSPASLTFQADATALNAQTVTVTGVQDLATDGTIAYTIQTGTGTGGDAKYQVDPDDVSVSNTDDDTPGITVTPISGLQTTEAGGTATFSVVLNTLPTTDVVIGISSSDTGEGTVSAASLTFTNANGTTPQIVTVTGIDDTFVDGNVGYQIVTAAATGDAAYAGINASDVLATNVDNDAAGVTVTPTSGLTTTEAGGTATFTVVLDTTPTSNVSLTLSSSDTGEGTPSPASLTFTPANALTPQTVTVTGVDDAINDGPVLYLIQTGATTSTDPLYNGVTVLNVSVTNSDDDLPSVTVVATDPSASEAGGTGTYTVTRAGFTGNSLTVNFAMSGTANNGTDYASLGPSVTIPLNQSSATVTLTPTDDAFDEGSGETAILTLSADAAYTVGSPGAATVTIADDDTAGVTVTPTSGLITTEAGGTATFTVRLDTLPSADVTIALSSSDTSEGTVSPASLTFTSANGTTAQTVTLTGVDDLVDDGNISYTIVTAAASSSDTDYNGLNGADVSASNTDDDAAGITVTPTSGLVTTEAGGTATFTVRLDTLPTADVTIALSSSDTSEGNVSPASLTFTSTNGTTAQTVTITGVDDGVDDGDVSYTILTAAATSSDGAYNSLNGADVSVSNTDDDTAGITVTPTSGLVTTEAGGTATFTVRLDTLPTADVSISLSSSDTSEGTVAPASLTFTSANGTTAQTVTVTGVDDLVIDGPIAYTIVTAAASSSDTAYDTLNAADVSVSNSDDDAAGITVTPTSGLVTTEAGGTATFTVRLDTLPSADVTIALSSSDTSEGTVSPASLTFTSANGTTAQTVTVTGVDDAVIDGAIAYTIVTAPASSSDTAYDTLNAADVSVGNSDDDTAGITVAPTSGLVTTEAGGTATFTVRLDTLPTADVTIALSSSDTSEGTVAPTSLTFTPANGTTAQTVTVTGVDDLLIDGAIAYSIVTAAASSSDTNYDTLNAADVSVSNTDDDTAGITVTPTSGLVTTEAGGTATFTVRLDTLPSADVTIALSSSDASEGAVSPTTLTFTSANGTTAQTVTITGVDDLVDDGNVSYSIVTAAASSSDTNYSGLDAADVTVSNTDNDTAEITVTPTSGLTTTEAGGTATFTVRLNTLPTADVTIALSSSDTSEGTVAPASLTFTSANGTTAQTVTVTGVDDLVVDGSIAYTIVTAAASSSDTSYSGLNPTDVSVSNSDDDTAGITVTPTSGLTTTEAGGTATFTVALDSLPTADVTIALSSSDTSEGTISPASLTFTSTNGTTAQTVTITGVDDASVDGAIAYTIVTAPASSSDTAYNTLNAADVSASNRDDDTAGITVTPTSGLVTTEAGGTATFTVALDSLPSADVTIALSSSDTSEGTVSPASLTFTSANGTTAQTVTITGVDDAVVDGAIAYSIVTAAASSADTDYSGLDPADVSASNSDDDTAGITVTPTSGLVTTEAGGTATFTVRLDTLPTADVTIALSSSDTGEGTVSPASLTFTSANGTTAQTVTVTGVDDAVDDGAIAYTIVTAAASSSDTNYSGLNAADVSVSNSDDDTAGILVTPTSGLTTTEAGGTATFTVRLATLPTADVTIALSSSDTSEGTVAPASLTFTAANGTTAQTVTVTGVDDLVIDGAIAYTIVTAAASSSDTNYSGLNGADVAVSNSDDDTAGITVTPTSGLATTEGGGTATFTVRLNTLPTADVTIALSSSDTSEGTIAPTSLTFTAANGTTPQTVTITGVDDALIDGAIAYSIVTAPATSSDTNYDTLNSSDVSVSNTDDDSAGVTVTPTSGLVTTEAGGTATFTVRLNTLPTADVTIALSSSDTGEGTVSPASLTFTSANGTTPQTVTVTGVDDAVVDGAIAYTIVTAPATSTDTNYNAVNPADVSVSNSDDDTAGITVSPTSGLVTTEAGGTATFTVRLDTFPSADVTIALSSGDTSEGTISPASLTFTSANGTTPQTVTVTGVDDAIVDGPITYTIVTAPASSADTNYNTLNPSDVSLSNSDDDTAGITVTPTSGLTTTEAGGTATFTIRLDTLPSADVTIALSSSDTSEGTVSPASLTFTSANGTTAQTVTVTGVDDALIDGPIAYSIVTAAAASADSNYSGVNASDVSVSNSDDDTAGITVTPTSGLVTTEAGGTATFTVRLNTLPSADVTIALSSSDTSEGTVSPTTLTFTSANGITPQTVTITGVDDALIDGAIAYSIVTAPASSADTNYNALNGADVTVSNSDNDTAGITISPTSGLTTTEAGGTATFTVALNTLPSADVTIALSSSDTSEGTVSPTTLTFTSANGTTPQTVTITGVDDLVIDGAIAYSIVTGAASSSDTNYNGLNPADVSVSNSDDDTAGVVVTPTSGLTTTEAGGTATFTVRLATLPSADVTIALTSSDPTEGSVSPATLTFTSANGTTAQTVTVTGLDDAVIDGAIVYTIQTGAASSSDTNYNGLNPADVSLSNSDDDSAGIVVSPTSGLTTTEAGGTATFTVRLTSLPSTDVTIALSSSDTSEGTVAPATLTFTAANGTSPQTVTVTGVDDALIDGAIAYSIVTAPASSTDSNYNGVNPSDVSLSNSDDDAAGFTVTPTSGLSTTEAGGTATFTVRLDTLPSADVTIALSSSDTSEGTVAPATLTFTAASGTTPQTVTITGVDDALLDGAIAYTIVTGAASSADTNYSGLDPADVSVSNSDDDAAGITVTPTSLTTTEAGGTATFTVALNTLPTADVTIALSSSDTSEGTVAPTSLTFTSANGTTPQTVTITGVDDAVIDGAIAYTIVTAPASSTDTNYNGLNGADVSVSNSDDDTAGVVVTPTNGLVTTEAGGTATFTVRLTSLPAADVSIALSSSDTSEGTVSPTTLTFTSANGTTAQTVTVTGVNDAIVDGAIAYTIVTAPASSSDTNYNGLNGADVSVSNSDNDTAGIVVTPTSGLTTTEAGGTATFTVRLATIPSADVTIALSSSDTSEGLPSPASLTFTPANALTPQTVTVTGQDDALIDGPIAYSIVTAAASSADGNYNALNGADVSLSNSDDDTATFTITPTSGLVTTEAGGTATFTVRLDALPTADVTIALSSSDTSEGTVAPTTLTFTSANGTTPQTVTITGVDDALLDGAIAYTILTGAAMSADTNFNGVDPADVSVSNSDDDTAGVVVTPTSGTTTEAGGTVTFTVALTSLPTADVTIALSSSDTSEGTVSPASLTFTSANGTTPQTVTVTGVDDTLDDGDLAYTVITGAASSTDTNYSGLNGADVSLTNTDDDAAGFTIAPTSGLMTSEAGGQATFTVRLNSTPSADVTVSLSSSDTGEGTLSASSLTFTPANALTAQTITITGVDDAVIDGPLAYTILTAAASSADGTYNGIDPADVSVTNSDDDSPGITITPTSLTTTEAGGTATFSVVLTSLPSADVTISLTSGDTSEGSLSASSLTFTSANGTTPQTVTVTGVDDLLIDGAISYSVVTGAASSADSNYNGLNPSDVTVSNSDDDTATFSINPAGGMTTTEAGGTATFTVALNAFPTADVTISLTSSDTSEGAVSPTTLTFTPANGTTPQTVTVTGVDDALLDGPIAYTIVTGAATSADTNYNGVDPADVGLTNADDDTAAVIVTPTAGLTTTEAGGTATFTVRLTTLPSADVTIALTSSDTSEGTVAPASLTFTTANGTTPQTVTLTGVDDSLDDGDVAYTIVTGAASSSDTNYSGLNPADVSASNSDDDTAGFTITPTSGLTTTEAGGTATFTVVLNSVPTGDVTLSLLSNDTSEGTVSPGSLVFTPANALTPQTVTITGVDDAVADGAVSYQIVTGPASSTDTNYSGLNPSDVSLSNSDDDAVGVTVTPTSGLTTTEAGGTATFTVRLNTLPTADVTISLSSDDTSEGTVSPVTLTFTPTNGTTAQTVTVTGVDDTLADGTIAYSIVTAPASSTDGAYDGLNPSDVSLSNTNDDAVGFTVTPTSGLTTTEGGGTATFTVRLNATPLADVTIGLSSSDASEGTVAPASLTFTPANALTAQTVTVTGVDDAVLDGNVAYTIQTAPATSADAAYNGLDPADVSVSNSDDEAAGITVTPTSGLVTTEAGGTATFTVALNTLPTSNVTIALSSSDTSEGTVSPASLTFTAANGTTPQTVTLTGVDDGTVDGSVAYTIVTAPASSADAAYNGLDPSDVSASNSDDDTAGITITPTSGLVTTEAGGTATFTVVLASTPSADVTIALSSSDTSEGTPSVSSLTFNAANGTTPQTVTVTGVNDTLADGSIAYSIVTAAAASSDPSYSGLNPSDVSLTNTDDDTAGFTVSPTSGLTTTEAGGTATFTVALSSTPSADVTISLGSSDPSEGTVAPTSLTFTPANATTPQTVTITGVDDAIDDGDVGYTITTSGAVSSDPGYSGLNPSDVSVTNSDDEVPAVTITPTSGLATSEAGGTATFTVALATTPTANVTIGLSSSDTSEGTVSPATLTFTPANASTPQTVTITGVDDALEDGDVPFTIVTAAAVSADASYSGLNPADVSVANTDDENAGLLAFSSAQFDVDEDAGTVTITVSRTSGSAGAVSVDYATSDQTALAGSDYTSTSGTLNFAAGQTSASFTVPVSDDALREQFETIGLTLTNPTGGAALGPQATSTVILSDEPTPTIVTPSLPGGMLGAPYAAPVELEDGGTGPRYEWTISAGAVPPGLSLVGSGPSAQLVGTPTQTGTFTFTVSSEDSAGLVATRSYTVTVAASAPTTNPEIGDLAPPTGTVRQPYDHRPALQNGAGPYTWSIASGALPPGLTLDPVSGRIAGTPTQTGTFTICLQVTDSNSLTDTSATGSCAAGEEQTFTIQPDRIQIQSAAIPSPVSGSPYGAVIELADSGVGATYTWSVSSGALPPGLSLSGTGTQVSLSGTPTAPGTYTFTLQASDDGQTGVSDTQTYVLVVGAPGAPGVSVQLGPSSLPGGTQGATYSAQLVPSGGQGPYTLAVTGGSLPSGLSLNPSTGLLSGTPTAGGTTSFTVTVTDQNGQTSTRTYTLLIAAPPQVITTALPGAVQGNGYAAQVEGINGQRPYAWSLVGGVGPDAAGNLSGGGLPTGLVMNVTSGVISGTPTAGPGTYPLTVQLTDREGVSVTRALSIQLLGPSATPSVVTQSLAPGEVAQPYSATLQATAGTPGYTWALTSGTLPAGLNLDPTTGVISGTPSALGSASLVFTVTDQLAQTASSVAMTLEIRGPVTITTTTLPNSTSGTPFSTPLANTGGVGPYTWTLLAGSLPPGLSMGTNGVISGTTTSLGSFPLSVRVTDSAGKVSVRSLTLTVAAPVTTPPGPGPTPAPGLQITTTTLPGGVVGSPFDQPIVATGGRGPYTFVSNGGLPPGLALDPGTGRLSGTPSGSGSFSFTVTVMDQDGLIVSQTYTVVIAVAPAASSGGGGVLNARVQGSGGCQLSPSQQPLGAWPFLLLLLLLLGPRALLPRR